MDIIKWLFSFFSMLGIIFIAFFSIFYFLHYLLRGFGLYSLALKNGKQNLAILAWIPFGHNYLTAVLSGGINLFNVFFMQADVTAIVFLLLSIGFSIPMAGGIFWLIYQIFRVHIYFELYKKFGILDSNALIMALIASFIPFVASILFFIYRDSVLES